MDLQVYKIKGKGDIKNERLLLRASAAVNTWNYGIGKTYGDDVNIYPILDNFFMLPEVNLLWGDFICIHTGSGEQERLVINKRTNLVRVYMGLDKCIWGSSDKIVLIRMSDYQISTAGDFT